MNKPGEWTHDEETGKSTVSKVCSVTNKLHTVTVTSEQYHRWHYGKELIQEVMPELNGDQREILISGTTPDEWNQMFGEE